MVVLFFQWNGISILPEADPSHFVYLNASRSWGLWWLLERPMVSSPVVKLLVADAYHFQGTHPHTDCCGKLGEGVAWKGGLLLL